MTSPFRVKPYAHRDYKFVVRAKLNGQWKRRYFRTEQEATAFAAEQNARTRDTNGTDAPTRPQPRPHAIDNSAESAAMPSAEGPRHALRWTGERLLPTSPRAIAYEHLHRYAIACGLAGGKRVLDIACGEGYGANLLAGYAVEVIGIDIDAAAIAHAAAEYRRPNLRFVKGDCLAIPLPDQSVDLVASFETIEHLREHDRFLAEIRRVLTPTGLLVISSPDRTEYARVSIQPNPFHLAELTHEDFAKLLSREFENVVTGKQRLVFGSWIAPENTAEEIASATADGWFDGLTIEAGVYRGVYSVAVCSAAPLPPISFGVFENFQETAETWDLLNRYGSAAEIAMHLSSLQADSAATNRRLETRSLRLHTLKRRREAQAQELAALHLQSADKSAQIADLKTTAQFLSEQLDGARERQRAMEAQLTQALRDSADAIEARWEALTLQADLLRGKDGAVDANSRLSETEDRANAANAERDQLRQMVLSMEQDLEQERLNVAAIEHRLRLAEQRAEDSERAAGEGAATDGDGDPTSPMVAKLRDLQQQLYAAEDRASAALAAARATEQRAAASEDQLHTIQAQWEETQAQLRTTGKELAARRAQISALRERLARRLILPFGKMQRRIDELTRS